MASHEGTGPHRSPAKHQAILDAAIEVFCDLGYARASVDAIAARAGVGKQTVYGHFGDKQQLFVAAVNAARTEDFAGPELFAGSKGEPEADLAAAGERILDVVLGPKVAALHRLTIAEVRHHPELQRGWKSMSNPADEVIAGYLRDCKTLEVPDPERAAREFTLLIICEARVETAHGTFPLDPDRRTEIARAGARLIVRAYRPRQ